MPCLISHDVFGKAFPPALLTRDIAEFISTVTLSFTLGSIVLTLRYTSFQNLQVHFLIHSEVANHFNDVKVEYHVSKRILMYIAGDTVNVLNIVNVQTYFIYVCDIAIFFNELSVEIKKR